MTSKNSISLGSASSTSLRFLFVPALRARLDSASARSFKRAFVLSRSSSLCAFRDLGRVASEIYSRISSSKEKVEDSRSLTGRASSTPILDMRMNERLKYFTAFAASSGVL